MNDPETITGTSRAADPALDLLVEQLTNALLAGEHVDLDLLVAAHPEHEEQLRSLFPALELMASLRRLAGGEDGPTRGSDADHPLESGSLGDYRIVREIGRGGMGIVYEALQISLNRRVALKVLPFAAALDPRQRQRFQVEAQAAAHLHHNHIVPIFSTGCERGLHFYAMQYIEGRSLAEMIRELKRLDKEGGAGAGPFQKASDLPELAAALDSSGAAAEAREGRSAGQVGTLSSRSGSASSSSDSARSSNPTATKAFFRTVAQMGVQAAEAIEHAHALGVLHRDIKPANLLVEPQGNLWVTDFGLARFQAEAGITMTGDVLGTLRYMSPEQALGKRVVVDHRTDIYALGATLYELISLHPAFDGRDREELMRQIAFEEPKPPRVFNSALPRDLETIVLKAMAKEPESRYSSAQELADDLTLFLDDKPIRARRPTLFEQTAKWSRRHRAVVATASGVLLIAAVVGAGLLWVEKQRTLAALKTLQQSRQREREALLLTFDAADKMTMGAMTQLAIKDAQSHTDEARKFYPVARDFYKRIAELATSNPEMTGMSAEAYYRLAFTRTVLGELGENEAESDYRRSIALFERVIAQSPHDPEPRRRMAESLNYLGFLISLRHQGKLKDAEEYYRRSLSVQYELVAEFPENYEYLVDLARGALEFNEKLEQEKRAADAQGVRRQVLDRFSKLAQEVPDAPDRQMELVIAHQKLGSMLVEKGHRREAEHIFRQALELDPNNPGSYTKLALLLAGPADQPPHDPTQAIALAKKAIALAPRTKEGWIALGLAQFRSRNWDASLEALDHSMNLSNGGDGSDWVVLAMVRWKRGEKSEARRWFDQASSSVDPNKPMDPQLRQCLTEAASLLGKASHSDSGPSPAAEPSEESEESEESEVGPSAASESTSPLQVKPASTPTECLKSPVSPRV